MYTGWDKEGTVSRPLSGSHWPPGAEEVTILSIATISKLFGSMYIHQNSRATPSLIALCDQDRLFPEFLRNMFWLTQLGKLPLQTYVRVGTLQ